ncbi:O-antigen ligase family protein [Agromyces sp. SYSU T00194]|uniref:O-antigen ligase family protein n=1 Tax=Agromyces chitinivorans TaxID=3158560 RepID=UPI0033948D20
MSPTSTTSRILRERLVEWWAGAWRWVLLAVGAATAVYILLDQRAQNPEMMAFALAALVIAAAVTNAVPLAIALVAMPGLLIIQRVGLGGTDLSVSDVALAAAFGTALLLGHRPYSPPLRALLWLNFLYQFTTLITVVVNPYTANAVEWFHAWLLISGALIVGWAVGHAGYARLALGLMAAVAVFIAVVTIVHAAIQYSSGNFGAIYLTWPFPMHKNFVGTTLALVAVVAYINPDWLGWSRRLATSTFLLLTVAVLLSQSRQAMIGLIAAVIVGVIRRRTTGRSRAIVFLLVIPATWLVISMVVEQVESQNQFNSVYQRLNWFRDVYHLWAESPAFGHGLRYWYQIPGAFQPPQAELEIVASTGLFGLLGFAVMWLGILIVLWRVDPRFGTLAFAIVFSRIVQAQFDLFWVAAAVSIPFVVAGICLGVMQRTHDIEAAADSAGSGDARIDDAEPAQAGRR